MTEVRLQTVSLYTRLELLVEATKAMQEQCRVLEGMQRAMGGGESRDTLEPCCVQLLSTVCHPTALYCSRLLQVGGQSDTQTAVLSLGMRLEITAIVESWTHTHTPHTHTLLTQGVDSGVEETIRESCQHLHESLDTVTCLAGQISLGRKLVERRVCAQLRPTEEGGGEEWGTLDNSDDFLSEQVKREGGREGQEGCDETTPLDFI